MPHRSFDRFWKGGRGEERCGRGLRRCTGCELGGIGEIGGWFGPEQSHSPLSSFGPVLSLCSLCSECRRNRRCVRSRNLELSWHRTLPLSYRKGAKACGAAEGIRRRQAGPIWRIAPREGCLKASMNGCSRTGRAVSCKKRPSAQDNDDAFSAQDARRQHTPVFAMMAAACRV